MIGATALSVRLVDHCIGNIANNLSYPAFPDTKMRIHFTKERVKEQAIEAGLTGM